jgi:glycerophosphoryl diester phosphodiesterase
VSRARVFGGGAGALVVGHRGGRGEGWPPENTMAAFARAASEGALAIELDVRTCAGGDLVVFHDADLSRMTGGDDRRLVSELTLGQLGQLRLGAERERIPTLADVLHWARGRVAVNVEAKRDVADRVVLARAIARALRAHAAEVLLSSFDPLVLTALLALAPRIPRAWLTHDGQRRYARAWVPMALRAPIDAVHLERTQAAPELIDRFKRNGLAVGVWTVNDPSEARDLVRLGVDWIITDQPRAVHEAIRGMNHEDTRARRPEY